MIDFQISELVPRFVMADRNGHAMARAIEKALQIMCDKVETGLETVLNVDRMPEWRLDEMAWELGVLYDYSADVEEKRRWIREATPMFAAYGTPQAIYDYLSGVFEKVLVQESWDYGAAPFTFRVIVSGEYTAGRAAWAMQAIRQTKNVRSVLDGLVFAKPTDSCIVLTIGRVWADIPYPLCGDPVCGGEMCLT